MAHTFLKMHRCVALAFNKTRRAIFMFSLFTIRIPIIDLSSGHQEKNRCVLFSDLKKTSFVQVTDGVQSLEAMEYQPVPALSTALR